MVENKEEVSQLWVKPTGLKWGGTQRGFERELGQGQEKLGSS